MQRQPLCLCASCRLPTSFISLVNANAVSVTQCFMQLLPMPLCFQTPEFSRQASVPRLQAWVPGHTLTRAYLIFEISFAQPGFLNHITDGQSPPRSQKLKVCAWTGSGSQSSTRAPRSANNKYPQKEPMTCLTNMRYVFA